MQNSPFAMNAVSNLLVKITKVMTVSKRGHIVGKFGSIFSARVNHNNFDVMTGMSRDKVGKTLRMVWLIEYITRYY